MMTTSQEIRAKQLTGLHQKLFDNRKSNMRKYQEMFVGSNSWLSLLRYELTLLLIGQLPGALGLALRKKFYKPLFKHVGRNVVFGQNLTLRHPHKISIGDNVVVEDYCLLDAKGESNEGIFIGDWVTLGRFSSLTCKNGDIRVGSHVNMGSSVKFVVAEGGVVEVDDNVSIGSGCHFSGGSYDYSQVDILPSAIRTPSKGIFIEEVVLVGAGVIVLDGVRIGAKSVVGAGSVVTKDIPAHSIAAGAPATVKRKRI